MLCRVKYALFVVVALLVGVSCQRPDEGNLDITLTVRCAANVSAPEYFTSVQVVPGDESSATLAHNVVPLGSRFEEDVCLRYVVDLYEVTSSKSVFVERQVFFVEDQKDDADGILDMVEATFNVNPTKYKVLFWCDYVQGSAKDANLETWFTNGWY
ncbi:MAG: hypothetical protein J6R01_08050, partial [Alistipes sp.]|nr:hypothetical protein [Alistipes sp.]